MTDFDFPTEVGDEEDIATSGKGGKNNNVVKHLIDSYGGINSLMTSIANIVKYIPKFKHHKQISFIGRGVSISMVIYDLIVKIKAYYDEKNSSVQDEKTEYIHTILNNDDREYRYRYDSHELRVTGEHIDWMINPHNDEMGGISIKSYYDLTAGKKYNQIPGAKSFGILVDFKETLMLLEVDQMNVLGSQIYTFKKLWTLDSEHVKVLVDTMNARYMDSVGFDDNVIAYDGINIITRPRSNSVDFDIESIDFDRIVKNISTVLDEGGRRGILFTGNPGTGKTSVLLKLEEVMKDYPILYITANNLNDEYAINRLESFIHNIGKCIVLIEDMDSLEIERKTRKIAPMLGLLDNSRNMSPVVFVATINDASLITPSIARTGRFDEVIEIKEPSTSKEIYSILNTAWMRQADVNLHKDLSFMTYARLKRNKLTQSDYCELVQKLHLKKQDFNDANVIQAMKELVVSKRAFKKYAKKKVK